MLFSELRQKMNSIAKIFFENAAKNPEKIAVWCDGEIISYRELAVLVKKWSNLLIDNNVRYGDHIGVLLPNNIEFVALMLVASNIGVAIVPLNPTLPANAIEHAFYSADVKHIIGISSSMETLSRKNLKDVTGLWLCMDDEAADIKFFKKLIKSYSDNEITNLNITGNETLILTMTSGSTGEPKPIILTQKNKIDRALAACSLYSVTSRDNILAATPLYHSLAERLVLMPLLIGATSILMPRFSPSMWLKCVKEQKVSFTIAVSSQLTQLVDFLTNSSLPEISSLRCIVSSSALLENNIKSKLLENLKCDFHECYGTSEIAIATNLNLIDSKTKLKSVGKAIPNVDLKILKDDGSFAKPGEAGEIICKTPMLFGGYYKLPELTKKAMFGEYFCTGDIGKLDDDGFLTFIDRKKDIIITGGINVYPKDIETVIMQIPSIEECAAISLPDEKLGEIVAVALVAKKSCEIDLRKVKFHCASNLADFQQPRKYFIINKLPRNNMGKLTKHALVQQLIQ
jgi:long-chain acyl-CoA synthetase